MHAVIALVGRIFFIFILAPEKKNGVWVGSVEGRGMVRRGGFGDGSMGACARGWTAIVWRAMTGRHFEAFACVGNIITILVLVQVDPWVGKA